MASSGPTIEKDLLQVIKGIESEAVKKEAAANPTASTTNPVTSASAKPSLFFKFGKLLARAYLTLLSCSCEKGKKAVSTQTEGQSNEAPVSAAPKI
jgi:hypothetical protein